MAVFVSTTAIAQTGGEDELPPAAELARAGAATNPFYGAATSRVPIQVPSFHGLEPQLSLHASTSGRNGFVGVDWDLSGFQVIERMSPGKGAPRWNSSDIYVLDGEELIPSGSLGGDYVTRRQSYQRIKKKFESSEYVWYVTRRDGTVLRFKRIWQGMSYGWRWGLDRVTDTRGNVVTYTWWSDGTGLSQRGAYPSSITYNGTTISFVRESRPDSSYSTNGSPYIGEQRYRLEKITVKVLGSTVRTYSIDYTTTAASGRSRVASIQECGGGLCMPALTVSGPSTNAAFASFSPWANQISTYSWSGQRTGDFNGDGKTDLLVLDNSASTYCSSGSWKFKVALSNGSGFQTPTSWGTFPSSCLLFDGALYVVDLNGDGKDDLMYVPDHNSSYGTPTTWTVRLSTGTSFGSALNWGTFATASDTGVCTDSVQIGDFNGDGLPDLYYILKWNNGCYFYHEDHLGGARKHYVRLNTGSGFGSQQVWGNYEAWEDASFTRLGDFNGDGRSDLFYMYDGGAWADMRYRVVLSQGNGFAPSGAFGQAVWDWVAASSMVLVGDINGDGKSDVVYADDEKANWRAFVSLGNGFAPGQIWGSYLNYIPSGWITSVQTCLGSPRLADLNGDGMADLVYATTHSQLHVMESHGAGFGAYENRASIPGSFSCESVRLGDFDGNGRQDWLYTDTAGSWSSHRYRVALNTLTHEHATTYQNGYGSTTTLTFTPSSAWDNTNNPPIVQTVTSISVTDGRGGTSTIQLSYAGGLYDRQERQFLGFHYAKEVLPCITGESTCPYTETWYQQDYGSLSKPDEVKYRSGNGTLLSWTDHNYALGGNGTTTAFTSLEDYRWQYDYDGGMQRRTRVEYTYDGYGNVVQVRTFGDYDVSGDEKTVQTLYRPNTTNFIVGLPAGVATYNGIGTGGALLTEEYNYYDGATTWDQAPTVGNLTKKASWQNTTSSYQIEQMEYDSYGNVITQIDANGHAAHYEYDTTTHLYRIATTNDLGHRQTTLWNYQCGVPLETTDANGQVTSYTYDTLCRQTRVDSPLGGYQATFHVNVGNPATQHIRTETPGSSGQPAIYEETYVDGLGRIYKTLVSGSSGVAVRTDTTFDKRGNTESTTAPYTTGPAQAMVSRYDARNRPTLVTYPDGATRTTSYDAPWQVTVTDAEGHQTRTVINAFGQPLEISKLIDGAWVSTWLSYDSRMNLTGVLDHLGNSWTFEYDSLGKRVTETDPDLGTVTYEYDGTGLMRARVDAKLQRSEWDYDAANRLIAKRVRVGTPQMREDTVDYDEVRAGYFNIGRATSTSDGSGQTRTDYDAAGQAVRWEREIDGQWYTFDTGYDAAGRLLWKTYPDGDTVGTVAAPIQYDAAGRPRVIPGIVDDVSYSDNGAIATMTMANGVVTTRSYDPQRQRMIGLRTESSGMIFQDLVYARNGDGQIASIDSPFAGEGWSFAYDDAHRLRVARNTASGADTQTFTYNEIGNLISNSQIGCYSYPAPGMARPHAVLTAGPRSYGYDTNGNMTSWNGVSVVYDAEDRIIQNGADIFVYDSSGARTKQVAGGVVHLYPSPDYEIVDGVVTKYISLGALPVAKRVGAETFWLHPDHLGSVNVISDASGALVQRRTYRPFGEVRADATAHEEHRAFIGRHRDPSGLSYLNARYYDPAIGRFLSADPSEITTSGVGLNRYTYSMNDPINARDPSGLAAEEDENIKLGSHSDRLGIRFHGPNIGDKLPPYSYYPSDVRHTSNVAVMYGGSVFLLHLLENPVKIFGETRWDPIAIPAGHAYNAANVLNNAGISAPGGEGLLPNYYILGVALPIFNVNANNSSAGSAFSLNATATANEMFEGLEEINRQGPKFSFDSKRVSGWIQGGGSPATTTMDWTRLMYDELPTFSLVSTAAASARFYYKAIDGAYFGLDYRVVKDWTDGGSISSAGRAQAGYIGENVSLQIYYDTDLRKAGDRGPKNDYLGVALTGKF